FQTPAELLSELGFFYALDRSGVQRSLPFAVAQAGRDFGDAPPAAAKSLPKIPGLASASESYSPTRVLPLDFEKRPTTDRTDRDIAPPSSVAVQHHTLVA